MKDYPLPDGLCGTGSLKEGDVVRLVRSFAFAGVLGRCGMVLVVVPLTGAVVKYGPKNVHMHGRGSLFEIVERC